MAPFSIEDPMKLIFPNGEHSQALLSDGVNRIGSAPDSHIRLDRDNIAPVHAELAVQGNGVTLRVPDAGNPVSVNGKPVQGAMALRGGDLIGVGNVQMRYVVVEQASSSVKKNTDADAGATRLRMAIPKYVLRGVSGAAFGKTFPVPGQISIGRAPECDISIPTEEISRRHAQVKPTPDGLLVEDLGSSNGTFINGQSVQSGILKPGDELRLDAIRFLLVAPGMEIPAAQRPTTQLPVQAEGGGSGKWIAIGAAIAAAAGGVAAYLYMM
jgi:pSer/pThr/pTyr-binding forkhead associated (FHA) protein